MTWYKEFYQCQEEELTMTQPLTPAQFDASLTRDSRVEARWTSTGHRYVAPARVVKVNAKSLLVALEEDIKGSDKYGHATFLPANHVITLPRYASAGYSANNGAYPPVAIQEDYLLGNDVRPTPSPAGFDGQMEPWTDTHEPDDEYAGECDADLVPSLPAESRLPSPQEFTERVASDAPLCATCGHDRRGHRFDVWCTLCSCRWFVEEGAVDLRIKSSGFAHYTGTEDEDETPTHAWDEDGTLSLIYYPAPLPENENTAPVAPISLALDLADAHVELEEKWPLPLPEMQCIHCSLTETAAHEEPCFPGYAHGFPTRRLGETNTEAHARHRATEPRVWLYTTAPSDLDLGSTVEREIVGILHGRRGHPTDVTYRKVQLPMSQEPAQASAYGSGGWNTHTPAEWAELLGEAWFQARFVPRGCAPAEAPELEHAASAPQPLTDQAPAPMTLMNPLGHPGYDLTYGWCPKCTREVLMTDLHWTHTDAGATIQYCAQCLGLWADPAPAPSFDRNDAAWLARFDAMLTPASAPLVRGHFGMVSSRRDAWVAQAQRGTSGDMVWDMLEDWALDLATPQGLAPEAGAAPSGAVAEVLARGQLRWGEEERKVTSADVETGRVRWIRRGSLS